MGLIASQRFDVVPAIDSLTNAQISIDYAHHEIHDGSSFVVSYTDLAMGSGHWLGIGFTTPQGDKKLHLVAQWATLGIAHAEILEGATLTSGTATTATNRNRSSTKTSIIADSLKAYNSEVGTDNIAGGTTIHETYAFSAKSGGTETGSDRDEIILAPGTTYGIKVTSDAAGGKATLTLHWYEHTDKNI